ncbi:MAG: hypothetical protein FJZ58_01800 [Chlamydiae bacterium]|nr:hypothetical protein [Chlamydiota bacterium]
MNTLEELLKKAETASSPPAPPQGGIPQQRLSTLWRRTFQILLLPFLFMDLFAETIAKKIIRPPFLQEGACKRRGNCCHYILFPETKGWMRILFTFWSREIHGFYPRGLTYQQEGKTIEVMGCRHLRPDGSCGNYFFRPKVCRTWPIIRVFGFPKILKGCGYTFRLRPSYAKKYPHLLHVLQDEELTTPHKKQAPGPNTSES